MNSIDGAGDRSAVDGQGPTDCRIEREVDPDAAARFKHEVAARLADRELAARVQSHLRLRPRVVDARVIELGAEVAAARDRNGRCANVDLRPRLGDAPDVIRSLERLGGRRVRCYGDVRGRAHDGEQNHERRCDIARRALHRAANDQLETDHDQDHRPQVGQLQEAVDRNLSGVDQQRDDPDQDEDRRPEEAAVAVAQGLPRRTMKKMPSAISTSGQKMSPRSHQRTPRLCRRK